MTATELPQVPGPPEAAASRRTLRQRSFSTVPALLLGVVGAVLLLLWVGSSGYRQDLAALGATYALIALGMYVPFVMAGSLSLAYAAYAGIGAYSVAILSRETSWPIWVAWFIAPVVAAAVAVVLGLATRRLSGFYLTSVTLLFSIAFAAWLLDAGDLTGGGTGVYGIRPLDVLGWDPTRSEQVIMSVFLVVILAWGIDRLRQSPWGVVVRTMREVPLAVETAGVRTPVLMLVTLGFGAVVSSLAGALFASFVGGNHVGDVHRADRLPRHLHAPHRGGRHGVGSSRGRCPRRAVHPEHAVAVRKRHAHLVHRDDPHPPRGASWGARLHRRRSAASGADRRWGPAWLSRRCSPARGW